MSKDDDRGNFWYKLLKRNYDFDFTYNGTSYGLVYPSGKWLHEDDFAVKYINPGRYRLHIVELEKRPVNKKLFYITRILDTYIPNKGWVKI